MNKKLFLAIVFLAGCDPFDTRLAIVNKSKEVIFYSISGNDSISNSSPLYIRDNDTIWHQSSMVLPDSIVKLEMLGRNGWENFIKEKCRDSKLRLFLFDKNLLLNKTWDNIYSQQNYTRKYVLTVEDLKLKNWKLVYK
ncbi:hypothetical protein [Adhaeribacter rhizoryzae]|uniref:Lipoprotein n=1 Tax=Adhaeribacter rhizoryzae TaxID=2607907 RepID=A0A5M6D0E5_9BACT|nr:hypothetical protein [Adhaeribacter rhizoryzae]KAA5539039.1 hypothetical protein F0145_25205 [Adhaeribacter rhizoryzae]